MKKPKYYQVRLVNGYEHTSMEIKRCRKLSNAVKAAKKAGKLVRGIIGITIYIFPCF